MQLNAKAILYLKLEQPVSQLVTTIVSEVEVLLYKKREDVWKEDRTFEGNGDMEDR